MSVLLGSKVPDNMDSVQGTVPGKVLRDVGCRESWQEPQDNKEDTVEGRNLQDPEPEVCTEILPQESAASTMATRDSEKKHNREKLGSMRQSSIFRELTGL